jgi:hypothetical protein
MRWLFKGNREHRRKQAEQSIKHEEAARMMVDLFVRRNGMASAEIIGELERMHRFYSVAAWAPSGERGSYFYELASELSNAPLAPEETARLVGMLLWPKLRAYEDRGAPSCFVSTAIRSPSEAYIPTLAEHLNWLEEALKPLGSSEYRNDIASEIRLTKATIQACRLRP